MRKITADLAPTSLTFFSAATCAVHSRRYSSDTSRSKNVPRFCVIALGVLPSARLGAGVREAGRFLGSRNGAIGLHHGTLVFGTAPPGSFHRPEFRITP